MNLLRVYPRFLRRFGKCLSRSHQGPLIAEVLQSLQHCLSRGKVLWSRIFRPLVQKQASRLGRVVDAQAHGWLQPYRHFLFPPAALVHGLSPYQQEHSAVLVTETLQVRS